MTKKKIIIALIVLAIVFITGVLIIRLISPEDNWLCNKIGNCFKHGQPNLPNPASVHCEEVGGTLDIRTDSAGGQVGYCIFPDQSECEEWALLRNECVDDNVATTSPITNADKFRNLNIKAGDQITSPLKIIGESSGGWFFEGSFPIDLVDWDGRIIATGLAQAKSEWMTTNFVPFEAEIKFTKPANPTNQDYAKRGALIFRKDNPSGLSINDQAYELPIKF